MRYDSHQHLSPTLEKLVEVEVQDGHRNSTGCLVRLVRCVVSFILSENLLRRAFLSLDQTNIWKRILSSNRTHPSGLTRPLDFTPCFASTFATSLLDLMLTTFPIFISLDRGLAFTCQALQNVQSDRSAELHVCFKRAYDTVLRHHHTFVIRSVVSVRLSHSSLRHSHSPSLPSHLSLLITPFYLHLCPMFLSDLFWVSSGLHRSRSAPSPADTTSTTASHKAAQSKNSTKRWRNG